ncbi:MAG: hypothetical protein Q9224_000820 [Gallowayella concinna]
MGAALVTIPSVGYLIQPQLNKGQSHGDGEHGEHGEKERHEGAVEDEEKSEEDEESERESKVAPDGDAQGDDESGDSPDDENTGSASNDQPRLDHSVQDAGQGSPETSGGEDPKAGAHEVESGSNVEGVRFKGATSGGTREGEQGDTRKHIPDAKGFNKKRIESDYGKEQGQLDGEDSPGTDKACILFTFDIGTLTDWGSGCTFEAANTLRIWTAVPTKARKEKAWWKRPRSKDRSTLDALRYPRAAKRDDGLQLTLE